MPLPERIKAVEMLEIPADVVVRLEKNGFKIADPDGADRRKDSELYIIRGTEERVLNDLLIATLWNFFLVNKGGTVEIDKQGDIVTAYLEVVQR